MDDGAGLLRTLTLAQLVAKSWALDEMNLFCWEKACDLEYARCQRLQQDVVDR